MQNTADTVWIKVYLPSGTQASVTFGFQDGKLPRAVDIERAITEAGFLLSEPGIEAGEVAEPILYVCRYDHADKKTGELVPHIAFYPEKEHLTKRWVHTYLNNRDDIAAFEAATGVTVATMPIWDGDTHPERNNPKAQGFIVRLPKAIRIARETYTNKEGEIRHKLKRYVDSIGLPAATTGNGSQGSDKQAETVVMWTQQEQAAFWNNWRNIEQFSAEQILSALGVQKLGEFKGSRSQAIERMNKFVAGLKQASSQ